MALHRCERLGRFLFVRDAIRFRSVHGLVEDGAATKKRGVLGSYIAPAHPFKSTYGGCA
jgi:hypothetical protein